MENTYGIGVANRYALFLDDDADPLEVLKVQEQEKELKKKSKVAEKENKIKTETPKAKSTTSAQKKPIKDNQNVKSQEKREDSKKNGQRTTDTRAERNVKFSGENREERNNRRNRDEKSFNGAPEGRFNREDRPARKPENRGGNLTGNDNDINETGPRGRGGSQGNRPRQPRGDGTGRSFEGRRKREFDRQSGSDKTGVKPVDKREGAGAHNWGSHKDEIEELSKSIDIDAPWDPVDKLDEPGPKEETANDTVPGDTTITAPPVEEEVRELTLDEWKAQKAAGRQKPQYNLRKAGEGEDLTQWKKMYALNKKKGEEDDESEEEEYDASEYPQRVGRQKHVLDIEVRFSDSRRGGLSGSRARGGARGGRGGGDRGGPGGNKERNKNFRNNTEEQAGEEPAGRAEKGNSRQNARQQSAPKVDDEHDFPSLG